MNFEECWSMYYDAIEKISEPKARAKKIFDKAQSAGELDGFLYYIETTPRTGTFANAVTLYRFRDHISLVQVPRPVLPDLDDMGTLPDDPGTHNPASCMGVGRAS